MGDFFRYAWDILLRFAGGIGGVLGGGSLRFLCLLMGADYGTGLLLGVLGKSKKTADGRLSARACFTGLMRKGMMILIILAAAVLDTLSGQEDLLRRATTGFYICNECISLTENAALLGVPIPEKFLQALGAVKARERQLGANGNEWLQQQEFGGEKGR